MRHHLALLAAVATMLPTSSLLASSHREAPGIANDPAADLADIYVFKAAGSRADSHVAFVINVSPGYARQAGPNWYRFADDVLYEMHIDNNGDAVEDVTYQFRFKTLLDKGDNGSKNIISHLPPITYDGTKHRFSHDLAQTYTVTKVTGGRRSANAGQITAGDLKDFPVAPPRIGPGTTDNNKSTAEDQYDAYQALADNAIVSTDSGYKFFAGPRNDPFYVDLAGVFDSVRVRLPGITGTPVNANDMSNVLSIIFEVPKSEIVPDNSKPFIGVWSTTSRPQATVLRLDGKDPKVGGGWVQVSRLGNPLVNEVVIGLKDKDKFNATEPKDDVKNFASYVVRPQLAEIINSLYGTNGAIAAGFITDIKTDADRGDLVDAFVAGIKDVNRYPEASGTGDMIRVNFGSAAQGWPISGRGLKDDVVKTALTFLAECEYVTDSEIGIDISVKAIWSNHVNAKATKNCAVDDGLTADDEKATPGGSGQLADFPYLDLPFSAYYEE